MTRHSTRPLASTVLVCFSAVVLPLALAATACAQAWLPLEGEGQVTVTYQHSYVRDHLDFAGEKFDVGAIRSHTQVLSFEYGLTNKLALDADIAHVSSRYLGHVGPVPHGPVDTGSYHPTFQDARIAVRYNVYNGPVVVTPFVGLVIPTHHYETRGHSAVGRDLRELQMGVNVGRDLEGVLPRSYVHGRYSFAVVERVEEFNLNRSNADWEIGHLATRRLSLRFTGAWQRTHGGIDIPRDSDHPHFRDIHDRASRSGFIRLGGGATFSLSKSLDLHADYTSTVWGINTHAARGVSLGFSWRFSRGFTIGRSSAANAPARLSGAGLGL
jgi:hypothetical protein